MPNAVRVRVKSVGTLEAHPLDAVSGAQPHEGITEAPLEFTMMEFAEEGVSAAGAGVTRPLIWLRWCRLLLVVWFKCL